MKSKEIVVTTKTNTPVTLKLYPSDNGEYYVIDAIMSEEVVGTMTFKLKQHKCYLNRIEIIKPEFAHLGVGSLMLKFMEKAAIEQRCYNVDGKFYPFGDLGSYSREFYIKNGYEIYKEDYETYIYKDLERKNEKTI